MKHLKLSGFWIFSAIVVGWVLPVSVFSQQLEDLERLCNNATPANKVMARQAGYDLDELCNEIKSSVFRNPVIEVPPPVERDTVSSGIEVGIARETLSTLVIPEPGSDLKPFGYDLFANVPTTYAPAVSIPVSANYLLGPGDTLEILFYGKINDAFALEINREGFVDFPELGPVGLAGLTYGEAKEMLQARISAQIIGTQVSISMGSLRSMQVFVLGEAFKPGAYTVSSLSTITHVLVSSGGVSDIGSLRNIQLKRQGKLIASLDLYDLLLVGDTSKDIQVQPADVIYIPTVGDLVSVEGQVLRPAIYELKGGESVRDLIELAGGLGPKAFASSARLQRINEDGFLTVFDLDLNESNAKALTLQSGDHFIVDAITEFKKNIVTLSGAIRHEGEFSWREGMRISDIIPDRGKLNPDADLDIALIVRELENRSDIEVHIFKLDNLFSDASENYNPVLKSRDRIIVFSEYGDRAAALTSVNEKLKRQASINSLPRVVSSGGTVRFPGEYPFSNGMTVQELIDLSGGLLESAYSKAAEISRTDMSNPEQAEKVMLISDLDSPSSSKLQPSDYVEFRTVPDYRVTETIALEGEFKFPGTYVIEPGETLASVIRRAGGFSDKAFVGGSIFLRASLEEREQMEIDRLIKLLQEDLRFLDATADIEKISAQQGAIETLQNAVALGRLVIPLESILADPSREIVLKNGDRLMIPKLSQEITIIGEVRRPTSYLFDSEFSQSDYIEQSGGFKERADKKNIYIVKASGEVRVSNKSLFKFKSNRDSISPGDTIVVPLDTNTSILRGIPLLSEVSTIIYQLSLGAAAVRSFNNN